MTQPISETKHGSNWNAVALDLAKENDRLRAEKAELLETINVIHDHAVDACPSNKISHIEWLCRAALHKAANETEST